MAIPSISVGIAEQSLSSFLPPFSWKAEIDFLKRYQFSFMRQSSLVVDFYKPRWRAFRAEVMVKTHAACSLVSILACRSAILFLLRESVSISYLLLKEKMDWVLIGGPLSERGAKNSSVDTCRKACWWTLKNWRRNRVLLKRWEKRLKFGRIRHREDGEIRSMKNGRKKNSFESTEPRAQALARQTRHARKRGWEISGVYLRLNCPPLLEEEVPSQFEKSVFRGGLMRINCGEKNGWNGKAKSAERRLQQTKMTFA